MESRLLTVPEAAAMLNVSRPTIYRLVRTRQLPGVVHIRGSLRFKRSALEQYIEELPEENRPRRRRNA